MVESGLGNMVEWQWRWTRVLWQFWIIYWPRRIACHSIELQSVTRRRVIYNASSQLIMRFKSENALWNIKVVWKNLLDSRVVVWQKVCKAFIVIVFTVQICLPVHPASSFLSLSISFLSLDNEYDWASVLCKHNIWSGDTFCSSRAALVRKLFRAFRRRI